jgi:hypothetical protein
MGKNDGLYLYGVAVPLSVADANAIAAHVQDNGSIESKLSTVATGLLRDLAKGGIMIAPEWAERISTAIGTTDAPAIVAVVEKSVDRRGDATVVQWVVDPTQIAFYQQLADSNGVTLAHELKALMDYAYEQGWFGVAAPDAFKILLDAQQYRDLQQMFSKDIVTGQDVMARLNVAFDRAFAPEEGSDLVLDSLKG